MMLARLPYFFRQALGSVRESPLVSLLTSATIGAALIVSGMYTMGLENLERLALVWGRAASLSVYVADETPREQWEALRAKVAAMPGVNEARLLTPQEALERFRARGPEAQALVEGVSEEVLPASIDVSLAPGFTDLGSVEKLARRLSAIPGVGEVDYGRDELDRLRELVSALRYAGLFGGVVLLLATSLIVSNTIRLTVFARKDEILIQRLVGATSWFVRWPFVIEGSLWGLFGGASAALALWVANETLAPGLSRLSADVLGGLQIQLFAPDVAAALLVVGLALGAVGSALAVHRFLSVEAT